MESDPYHVFIFGALVGRGNLRRVFQQNKRIVQIFCYEIFRTRMPRDSLSFESIHRLDHSLKTSVISLVALLQELVNSIECILVNVR